MRSMTSVGGRHARTLVAWIACAMYWQADGLADLWSRAANGPLSPAKARMLVVGVRSAEIR